MGGLSGLFALVIEFPIGWAVDQIEYLHLRAFLRALFVAAIPEEMVKFWVFLYVALRHEDNRLPVDAFISAVCIGLGFATMENLLYVLGADSWSATGVKRAASAVPGHAVYGLVLGYFAMRQPNLTSKLNRSIIVGITSAVLLHAAYDFPLFGVKMFEEANLSEVSELYFYGFAVVILVVALIGAGCIEKAMRQMDDSYLPGRASIPHRFGRWLLAPGLWGVIGAGLTLAGASSIAYGLYPLVNSVDIRWEFIIFAIFPVVYGLFMARFGLNGRHS